MKGVVSHGLATGLLAVTTSLAALASWFLPETTKELHEFPWFEKLCEKISCPPAPDADASFTFPQIQKLRMIALSEKMSLAAIVINLHEEKQPFPVLDVHLFSAGNKLKKRFWIEPALYLQSAGESEGMAPGQEYPVIATVPHSDDEILWYKVLMKKGFPSLRTPIHDSKKHSSL